MNFKTLPSFLLLGLTQLFAQSPVLTQSGGWFEAVYAEWQPVSGASGYNVYYSGEGLIDQKIDAPLIRSYGSYLRADVPGLKAGSYTLKIVPVISGSEATPTITPSLNVIAHDRSGFAFNGGRVPGAYQTDGTPKNAAIIVYLTDKNKDSISLDVQTGSSAYTTATGMQAILDAYKKGKDTRPLIIRMIGQVTDLSYMLGGDLVIENANNASSYITFEGIGSDATADGWGLRIKNASNVEIRNLGVMNVNSTEGDNIGLQQNNDYIWVHNVDFFYGHAGSDPDQLKGDGALDCKKSTYITFAYNHFWDNGKTNLLGLSEGTTSGLYITYHHNWYDHSDSRHPRVRYYSAHVYNNYYDGNSKYGIGSTLGSSVFAEGNYFRNAKYPMLTSMQGSDVWDTSADKLDESIGTFSNEDGGSIKAWNNYMEGQKRFAPYNDASYTDSKVNFDAYVASSRNEQVLATVISRQGANTYNNFDTDSGIMYTYTAQSPIDAKTTVMQYAGRLNGGDFKWTFNNAVDDESYAVNTALKSALTNYTTSLVSIQSESGIVITSSSSQPSSSGAVSSSSVASSSSNTPSSSSYTVGDENHNFTASGLSSGFYTIEGNLSTAKGTVSYAGFTLTQCLKMESASRISFTTFSTDTITLVFNATFTGNIKIDGVNHLVNNGLLTLTLTPGAHEITKGDISNIYYIELHFESDSTTRLNAEEIPLAFSLSGAELDINPQFSHLKISIYDLRGSLIRPPILQTHRISLSNFSKGSYIVKIQSDQGEWRQQILVP